jgi:hypothetical protein
MHSSDTKRHTVFKHTGSADETAVYTDMPQNYSIEAKDAEEV